MQHCILRDDRKRVKQWRPKRKSVFPMDKAIAEDAFNIF